jgi:hypothetical protein
MSEIEELENYIKWLRSKIERTIATYGEGTRPSWVSADLGADWSRIHAAQRRIDEIKNMENDQ